MKRIAIPIVFGTLQLAWVGAAFAQTQPSAGSLLRQQELAAPLKPLQRPGAAEKELVRPPMPEISGVSVLVKSVRFSGVDGLATPAELQSLVQSSIGKHIGYPQLLQLADRVTDFLKAKGWFLARAYLPQQDLTDGTLEIALLSARLDGGLAGIDLSKPGVRLSEQHIRGILANTLLEAQTLGINSADLERALLTLNEIPGINSQAALDRGKAPDTSRLQISVTEGPLFMPSASFDNTGNRYTGTNRANGQIRIMDPYGAGDAITLSAGASQGMAQGAFSYSVPFGARGWSFATNASALRYELGADLSAKAFTGTARTLGANVSYPLILGNLLNLRGTLAADYKALNDLGNGLSLRDKRLTTWSASLAGDSQDTLGGGAVNTFSINLVQGRLDLSKDAADLVLDLTTGRTHGNFAKINYAYGRLQKLPGAFSLFANLNGQIANGNLDSAEKFILGGSGGVRAYPGGEASGDSGWTASLELRYDMPAPTSMGNLQWMAFVDTGGITLNKNVWGPAAITNFDNTNNYGLTGAGLGLTLSRSGSYNVRALWAQTVGSNPGRSVAGNNSDGLADKSRFLLVSSFYF